MTHDHRLRELERRFALDPSDDDAKLALAVERLRGGDRDAARATIGPASPDGYRLLCERAAPEPGLLALLDEAPEWRTSGGDPGCSRWSAAAAVARPRTAWRRRLDEVHAALAVVVDRGRAFAVTLGPRGTEVVAFSVLDGATLWRFALGSGAPAAPLAREGWVYAAVIEDTILRTVALAADGAVVWRAEDACDAGCLPGALNAVRGELVLPVATTWRGSSRVPDGRTRAFVIAHDATSGRNLWHEPAEQVFAEAPADGERLLIAGDYVTGVGRLMERSARGSHGWYGGFNAHPSFLTARADISCIAAGGTLEVSSRQGDWRSMGGSISSLALDGRRILVGRGADFAVKDVRSGATNAHWLTHESPLPYRPRGVAHPPPAPRSAVCAGDACYLASPLAPSLAAYSVTTGASLWRHEIDGLLVPEDGPRFTWPTSEAGPPDRGPLHLVPLPGRVLGITLSGYAFLVEEGVT